MLSQFFSLFMPVRVYDISSVVVACLCLRGRERETSGENEEKKSSFFPKTTTKRKKKLKNTREGPRERKKIRVVSTT